MIASLEILAALVQSDKHARNHRPRATAINARHCRQSTTKTSWTRLWSIFGLSAIPAIDAYLDALPPYEAFKTAQAWDCRRQLANDFRNQKRDWRSWSLYSARLGEYIDANLARW